MMRRALATGFQAAYVLADSWFFSSRLASFALSKGIVLISRPKFNRWKYGLGGKYYTIGELVNKVRRGKKKWNKQLRLHHISAVVNFQGLKLKIFFYKEKKRGTKWQAIITTDLKLGAIQAYKVYQNRWTIEVSYKELKQHLGFGACQSRDFDAQISDLTMSLMAYNYLSQIKALNEYQSIGALFKEVSHRWLSPNLMQRFWSQLYLAIQNMAVLIQKDFNELLGIVMSNCNFFQEWHRINMNLGAET